MDEYFLANEKIIEQAWAEHYGEYKKLKDQFLGLDEYVWGGGVFDSPPF